MKNKQLTIIVTILLFNTIFITVKAIEPITLVAGSAISAVVKEVGDKARVYIYSTEEKHKRILKKHLDLQTLPSAIAHGCDGYFIVECGELGKHLEAMEKYYASTNEGECIKMQMNLLQKNNLDPMCLQQDMEQQEEQSQQEKQSDISYFQSLSSSEQQQLLKLQRALVIEYAKPENYIYELFSLHKALNRS